MADRPDHHDQAQPNSTAEFADSLARRAGLLAGLAHRAGAVDVDDCVQNALVAFLEHFSGPYSMPMAYRYLERCISTAAAKQRRRAQRKPAWPLSAAVTRDSHAELLIDPDSPDGEEKALRQELHEQRTRAFRSLPDDQRKVVGLRQLGYSGDEVGSLLNLSSRQVRKRIQKANRALDQSALVSGGA